MVIRRPDPTRLMVRRLSRGIPLRCADEPEWRLGAGVHYERYSQMTAGRCVTMSIVLILGLSACSSGQDPTMPGVVGRQLDTALQDIKLAGFKGDVDISGGGMLGVIDKANWKVCKQSPEAG